MDKKKYWQQQIRRTIVLLVIWAIVAFGFSILGVNYFNQFDFNGVPFGFWMAQQGSIIIFVLLILAYTLLTERADKKAGL